ncbi:MAG: hypothetical protein M1338_04830 [Patescibacteria group bacterium]|nr:hypothetical protein [Patescibacteria group bacterium]
MSEFVPIPQEEAEKETQGIALASEIAQLRDQAKTDKDYKIILQKTLELKRLFRVAKPETKLTGEIAEQIEKAEKILGKDCLGPEAVEKTFGISLESAKIPSIPFSSAELEKAKEMGQFLVLRVSTGPDGEPLTIEVMNDLLREKYATDESKVFYDTDWYKDEEFFTNETPEFTWALTSKEVIPNSTDKNYLGQTDAIVEYLNQIFPAGLPEEYQQAVEEYQSQRIEIESLISSDWQKAAEQLELLEITKLTRQTPVEAIYDLLMYHQNNGERLLENMYTWTKRRRSDGRLVDVGFFDADGVDVNNWRPDYSLDGLGVSFSRSL